MYLLLGVLMCSAAVFGANKPKHEEIKSSKTETKFELTSSFNNGQPLNPIHSWKAGNEAPILKWTSVPEGTRSLALICDDPDAPDKTWVHWVVFNIPPTMHELSESLGRKRSLSNGIQQGINDFGKIGYDGPYPPVGKAHRYFFKIYALDTQLKLNVGATKEELEKTMEGHKLASAQLIGTYARKAEEKKK